MRGDAHDHARRRDAGADRGLPRRAAREGRDRGRDRRLRGGNARARAARRAEAPRPRRHRRDGRRRREHVQHLDRGRARRGGRRSRDREARQPRGLVGERRSRRARVARFPARPAAGADRALDRRARLRLPLRAGAPSRDEARCARPARAGDAYRVQRARPAHEPRRRACAHARRLLARADADARRGARAARRRARVRRPRRGRHRRALAVRPEPRVRGRERERPRVRARPSRPRRRALRPGRAARRRPGLQRGGDATGARGEEGGHRSAVILNAAGGIAAAGHAENLREGIARAREAIDSGAATARLQELVEFSQA